MKLKFFIVIFILIPAFAKTQNIGIGTSIPHGSARLDVSADNKGFLPPRLTTSQRNAINSPAKGLLVFDSTKNSYWYFENSRWREIGISDKTLGGNVDEYIYDHGSQVPDSIRINQQQTSITSTSAVIFDTGGPSSNYGNNENNTAYIGLFGGSPNFTILGFRIKVTYDLAVNDTLFLHNGNLAFIGESSPGPVVKYYTNSSGADSLTIYNESSFAIRMKSNGSGNAAGFALKYQLLLWSYSSVPDNTAPSTGWHFLTSKLAMRGGTGNWLPDSAGVLSFAYGYNAKASGAYSTSFGYNAYASRDGAVAIGDKALASGSYSVALGSGPAAKGQYSTAIGAAATASGNYSLALGRGASTLATYATAIGLYTNASGYAATAFGDSTLASGTVSTAMGFRTQAAGDHATATGYNTEASGNYSTAIGYNATASGDYSNTIGRNVAASGDYSTSIGNYVTAGGNGSFAIGDNSVSQTIIFATANRMNMRFAGGYRLYTNPDRTAGAIMNAGDNSWSTISDIRKKEYYQPANGKDFLDKISAMQLGSWNYIGQDKNTFRHYGPMAQEFYKNFGNDGIGTIGNDTTIASSDVDGVMMIAIQALIKENEMLRSQNEKLEARLQKLEATLPGRKKPVKNNSIH